MGYFASAYFGNTTLQPSETGACCLSLLTGTLVAALFVWGLVSDFRQWCSRFGPCSCGAGHAVYVYDGMSSMDPVLVIGTSYQVCVRRELPSCLPAHQSS